MKRVCCDGGGRIYKRSSVLYRSKQGWSWEEDRRCFKCYPYCGQANKGLDQPRISSYSGLVVVSQILWLSKATLSTKDRKGQANGSSYHPISPIGFLPGTMKIRFCPGIPGAGKTMIAAIAVDHIYKILTIFVLPTYTATTKEENPRLL